MKYLFIFCLLVASCAKIPIQALELSDALKDEWERMHLLNLALIDNIFQEKRYMVNEFITNEYTPAYIDNFNEQKAGVINKLNEDYKVYSSAFSEMQNLLRSTAKLNKQQPGVY